MWCRIQIHFSKFKEVIFPVLASEVQVEVGEDFSAEKLNQILQDVNYKLMTAWDYMGRRDAPKVPPAEPVVPTEGESDARPA